MSKIGKLHLMINVYLCPSPALYPLYHRPKATVIVVDIFRASTTIVTAMANGAAGILPVMTTNEACIEGEAHNYLIAAERNVKRCDFAQLGNDPAEYTRERVEGQSIVFTTTNGTKSIRIALEHGAKEVLVGAFINLPDTLAYLKKQKVTEAMVLAAGWQDQVSLEDTLYAGALATMLTTDHSGMAANDAARMAHDLWTAHAADEDQRLEYLKQSEHYARLVSNNLADTVPYCLQIGSVSGVLGISEENGKAWIRSL